MTLEQKISQLIDENYKLKVENYELKEELKKVKEAQNGIRI